MVFLFYIMQSLRRTLPLFLVAFSLITLVAGGAESNLNSQLEKASSEEARADFRKAREIYEQATRDHPQSAEAWAALGEHLRFYAHDSKAAAEAFRSALKATEKNAHAEAFAWRGLGELEAKENHDEAAIEFFKKSIAAEALADTYRSLCHLYCKQRNFKLAAEAASAAVKLNPSDDIARLLYAAQLHRAGDTAEARKQFEGALADSGLTADAECKGSVHCCVIYNAAGYLSVIGDKERALKMLQRFFDTPNHRHLTREEIENDADFAPLKTETAFRNLLDKAYSRKPEKTND